MALSSATNRNNYTGNGSVSAYSYTFKITDDDDLNVVVRNTSDVETTLVKTTDYTVDGVGDDGGGTVTLVSAGQAWLTGGNLTTGFKISIRRIVDLTQITDIRNQGEFYPEIHELAFDKLTMIDQQQQDELDRSLKLPESVPSASFDMEFPGDILDSADKVPLVNEDGTGWALVEDWPSGSSIAAAQSNATAAAASATAAASSATAAAASETAAAASASSAAAALASAFFRDVVYITSADSPYTITQASHNGKLISVNSSGGAVSIVLPEIATLTPPFNVGVLLATAGNNVTVSRSATDTIGGATSKVLSIATTGCQFVADTGAAPDDYSVLDFGTVPDSSISRAKLATGAVAKISVSASKTANYTATNDDDLIRCDASAGSFTVTLPTAVGISGKVLQIKRTDQSLDKSVTIDGNGAETIDGVASKKLMTQFEEFTVVSDGTNWQVISHSYPENRNTFTPSSSGNLGPIANINLQWQRSGSSMIIQGHFTCGGTSAGVADIGLPSGVTAKTIGSGVQATPVGMWQNNDGTATRTKGGHLVISDTETSMKFNTFDYTPAVSGQTNINGNVVSVGGNAIVFINAIVPITDWEG